MRLFFAILSIPLLAAQNGPSPAQELELEHLARQYYEYRSQSADLRRQADLIDQKAQAMIVEFRPKIDAAAKTCASGKINEETFKCEPVPPKPDTKKAADKKK